MRGRTAWFTLTHYPSLQNQAGNETAISLLASAPATIVQPVYFTMNNVRPYNQPVATAITLVGAIYLLIFSFIVTMTLFPVREIMYVEMNLPLGGLPETRS